MPNSKIAIVGAGGHARNLIGALRAQNIEPEFLLDDNQERFGSRMMGIEIRGPIALVAELQDYNIVHGIGANRVRRDLVATYPNARWMTVIHPFAYVDPSSTIGEGTFINAGAIVQPCCNIGSHSVINTRASVDHDSTIGDFVMIYHGVTVDGGVTVQDGTLIYPGATVGQGLTIGAWSVIELGSAVKQNVPLENPAKPS